MFFLKSFRLYYYKFRQEEIKDSNKREKNFYIRTQKTKKHTLFAKKKKISHSKKDAFFRGNWHHTMIWMTYSNLKPQKVEKLKYEWWKTMFKTFEKENHVILEPTKFTSLATISISLLSQKKHQNQNPNWKKNPTLNSPVSSLYSTCTTISIKRNKKIRQLPPPINFKNY